MSSIEKIEVFSSFRDTMLEYFSKYGEAEDHKKKSTQSHRIAVIMSRFFPQSYSIDIDIHGTDILVKNGDSIPLSVFWSSTYLTKTEKDRAQKFHTEKKPTLTLAFSMLEEKGYILVYRFENEYLEYLHINKTDFSERLLKRCLIGKEDEEDQLMLDIQKRRIRKKKADVCTKVDSDYNT